MIVARSLACFCLLLCRRSSVQPSIMVPSCTVCRSWEALPHFWNLFGIFGNPNKNGTLLASLFSVHFQNPSPIRRKSWKMASCGLQATPPTKQASPLPALTPHSVLVAFPYRVAYTSMSCIRCTYTRYTRIHTPACWVDGHELFVEVSAGEQS